MVGSSPHARGTQQDVRRHRQLVRFIPACAGNAIVRRFDRSSGPVHPRMRGERQDNTSATIPNNGSSPHARGTHPTRQKGRDVHRFIPACAGNALHASRTRPRPNGSSPHARGTPVVAPVDHAAGRFIPACAGNAGSDFVEAFPVPVHPRMRGERQHVRLIYGGRRGSSPHARGTLRRT